MRPFRVAVAIRCLGRPLKPALILASEIGAVGVQLDARNELKPDEMSDTGRRQFLHLLEELGLDVASLDFPIRRSLWDPDRLDTRIDALKQTMAFAYSLKARCVIVRLGDWPNEADTPGRDLAKGVLDDLARHGNRVGVTLALGLGREPASRVVPILRDVKEGPIGINFDPAAAIMNGHPPADSLQVLGDSVEHVVVRDATHDTSGAAIEVPVGRGEVPWDETLAMLEELGYRGWHTVDRTQGDDKAGDAARAIRFLHSLYLG